MPTEGEQLALYRAQTRIRLFGKRAYDLFLRNLVKGISHLSLGQEAIAAGFAVAMRPDDYTFATYRGHAHVLAGGASMAAVTAGHPAAVAWLAHTLAAFGTALKPGQLVLPGAMTAAPFVSASRRAEARFNGLGSVLVIFV
jgi:hypothetical protein